MSKKNHRAHGNIIQARHSFEQARANARKSARIGTGRKLMVILKTEDPDAEEQHWFLVKPDDVPDYIKEPEVMGNLEIGLLAQPPGSEWWYRAESLIEFERTAQRTYQMTLN